MIVYLRHRPVPQNGTFRYKNHCSTENALSASATCEKLPNAAVPFSRERQSLSGELNAPQCTVEPFFGVERQIAAGRHGPCKPKFFQGFAGFRKVPGNWPIPPTERTFWEHLFRKGSTPDQLCALSRSYAHLHTCGHENGE